MKENEVINVIEEFIGLRGIYSSNSIHKSFLKEYQEAVKILLGLYYEGKKKIKELENEDLTTVYINGVYTGEEKWKNKIKEEIKKLEEMKDSIEDIDISRVKYAQLILKDLLDN